LTELGQPINICSQIENQLEKLLEDIHEQENQNGWVADLTQINVKITKIMHKIAESEMVLESANDR
jgi:hypothetical protein